MSRVAIWLGIAMFAACCAPRSAVPVTVSGSRREPTAKSTPSHVQRLVWHDASPPMLVAFADGVVTGSIDDGATWRRLDADQPFGPAAVRGIESDLSGGVIVRTGSGYFERSRVSHTWTPLLPSLPRTATLWFAPGDRAHIFAGTTENPFKPAANDSLRETIDGGRTWTEVVTPGGRVPHRLAVAPQSPAVLYATTLARSVAERGWGADMDVGRQRCWWRPVSL